MAVKIFHTSNAVFRNLAVHRGRPTLWWPQAASRDLVDIWVRKEHRNLERLARWGLPVPKAVAVHRNVLVMEYIGTDESPAKKLREVEVEDADAVYDTLLHFRLSWQKAHLVHGDFSLQYPLA